MSTEESPQNFASRTLAEAHIKIAARYRDVVRRTPEDEEVYSVAVAMCHAEGLDPDLIVLRGYSGRPPEPQMVHGHILMPTNVAPIWTSFWDQAKAAVEEIAKRDLTR